MCQNCHGTAAVCIGNVSDNAIVNIGCVGTCRPSGRLRWWSVSYWWTRINNSRLNDLATRLAAQEAANKAQVAAMETLTKRLEALEARPAIPACTVKHETRHVYVQVVRHYFWTWVFGVIAAAFGAFGSVIAVNYFRRTVITDDTPIGWIATSIADSAVFAWVFGFAATFVVTATGMLIGYIVDRIRNVRTTEELPGPVNS